MRDSDCGPAIDGRVLDSGVGDHCELHTVMYPKHKLFSLHTPIIRSSAVSSLWLDSAATGRRSVCVFTMSRTVSAKFL